MPEEWKLLTVGISAWKTASDAKEAIAEYDTIDTAKEDATDAALTDIESLDQDIDDPGKMVLANGLTVSDYMAQTKLAREQTRGKNKEDLLAIIDSDAQTELDKQAAIDAVVRLTDYSDKENAVETLLSAKGFDNSIVSITQDAVDVVICKDNLTDAELAQIEDIVKTQDFRKCISNLRYTDGNSKDRITSLQKSFDLI